MTRITEAELAAALRAVRHTPIMRVSRTVAGEREPASGHYRTDHDAHARLVMEAIPSIRAARKVAA